MAVISRFGRRFFALALCPVCPAKETQLSIPPSIPLPAQSTRTVKKLVEREDIP